MSRPRYVDVFQWNRECFFLRHMELNSRFIVMTMDEVTLNRPEVGTGFSVIRWFCRLRLSRFALKFSAEIFAPYGLFPPQSGFSDIVVSSWQLCCAICYWEYDFISFLWYQYFFRVDSKRKICDASNFSNSSRYAVRMSPFENFPAINSYSRNTR